MMRRTFVLLLSFIFSAVALAQGGGGSSRQSHSDWHRYAPDDEDFSVMMPAPPTTEKKVDHAKNGQPIRLHTYMADLGSRAYMVMVCTYENEDISLEGAVGGILGSFPDHTILERRSESFDGNPGRVLELKTEKFRMRYKLFVVGNRLYQIGYIADHDSFDRDARDYFMGSFRLR